MKFTAEQIEEAKEIATAIHFNYGSPDGIKWRNEIAQLIAEKEAAERERDRYAAAIRAHRDLRGNDRCWMDDNTLYAVLPEGYAPPTKDAKVCLEQCKEYINARLNPATGYKSSQSMIADLEEERDKYKAALIPAARELFYLADQVKARDGGSVRKALAGCNVALTPPAPAGTKP